MPKVVIGVDLGGTRIKTVALDPEGKLLYQLYTPTNDGSDNTWQDAVKKSIEELTKHLGITDFIAGISAPGIPDEKIQP